MVPVPTYHHHHHHHHQQHHAAATRAVVQLRRYQYQVPGTGTHRYQQQVPQVPGTVGLVSKVIFVERGEIVKIIGALLLLMGGYLMVYHHHTRRAFFAN